MRPALLLLAGLAIAGAAPVAAQKNAAFSGPLLNAHELKCTFTNYATARWDSGAPRVTTGTDSMALSVTTINAKKGTAMIAATATVPVDVGITATGITVIERTPIGNRNLLTVFATAAQDGSFPAVYSRHLGDTAALPTPSQYYGTCSIVN
jgi:hypothetical protein